MASSSAPASRSARGTFVIGCALSLLSGMGFSHGVASRHARHDREAAIQNPATWSDAAASVPVDSNDPIWGSRFAPVTIVLFSDFECPYCAQLEASIDRVKEHYDPNDLRIVWKHNPLGGHAHARPAAIAGKTVFRLGGSRAFWSFAEAAFGDQGSLDVEHFTDWAEEAGVPRERFRAAFESSEFAAKVDADVDLGVRLALVGAPMALVNGVLVRGAASFEKLSRIIDEEMERARELRATTPPDEVYVRATQENRAPPAPAPITSSAPPPIAPLDKTVYLAPLDPDDVVRGPADAPVTVVVFGDFAASTRAAHKTIERVLAKYEGRTRYVFRPRVRRGDAEGWRAANVLYEARKLRGDAGWWAAYAALFDPPTAPSLPTVTTDLGLALDDAVASDRHGRALARVASLASDLELPSTPAIFVNGRRFTGPPSEAELDALVTEELGHAASMIEGGATPAGVYTAILAQASGLPPPEKRPVGAPAPNAPWRGASDARVVVQIFVDLQSPYSRRARGVLADLERLFAGSIKVVWRHRPLPSSKDAILAAEAALEAYAQKGSDGFFKFTDAVFDAQGRSGDALSHASLVAIAKRLGMDAAAMDKALVSHAHRADVEADARAADEAGIAGVPAYAINGWLLVGNVPFARLERTVDLALRDVSGEGPRN